MQGELVHSVRYEFDEPATVAEVAASLVAQEKLLRDALQVLEACFPGLSIQESRVVVRSVSQASPLESDLRAFVVGVYSAELGQEMPDILQTLFGTDIPDTYDGWVSVIFLLLVLYGIEIVRKRIFPGQRNQGLEAEKRRLIKEAANRVSVTEEHLEEAVERVLARRNRAIARASLDVMTPAKRHKARAVVSEPAATIGEAAINATPSDVELEAYEPPVEVEDIEDVLIQFRMHDLDKPERWAATIEAVSPARRPLHLAPHINGEALFDRRAVRGDVTVTSMRSAEGEYVPSFYYLHRVRDDQPA
jgi:hypothetical protein